MSAENNFEELSLLYDISKALNEHMDLKKSLYRVLAILAESMNMLRGAIAILNPLRNEIRIKAAHGISRPAIKREKYKIGEGITGRVIETGEAVIIPRISEDPRFLDRTDSRGMKQEFSFFCVPIQKGNQTIGALSVDRPFDENYVLRGGKELLSTIASMVAHHVVNLEKIRVEKERLRTENLRLKSGLENKYRISNIVGNSNTLPEQSLEEAVARLEREMIIGALKNTRGNITQAAAMLKSTVRKVAYKAKKYGVDFHEYRQ